MATKKYTYAAGDTAWVTTFMEAIEKNWKGINKTVLTNWNATTVCAVDDGSLIEIAGSIYLSTTDTSIGGTASTGINYIEAIGSTLGCVFNWTQTAPTWRSDYMGWYATAASSTRVIGGCYYDGVSYKGKFIYKDYDNPVKWFSAMKGADIYSGDITAGGAGTLVFTGGTAYIYSTIVLPDNAYITKVRMTGNNGTGTSFVFQLGECGTALSAITHYSTVITAAGAFDAIDDFTTTNCCIDNEHGTYFLQAGVSTYSVQSNLYYLGCQYIQRDHQ